MANDSPVFLTDQRRAVLNNEYDGEDSTERAHQSNIRARSRTAIQELIEVAESPVIDTTEVFDPDDVFRLLRAIMSPDPTHTEGGGLYVGRGHEEAQEEGSDAPILDVDDDYLAYSDRLYVQLDKLMRPYRDERFPPYKSDE